MLAVITLASCDKFLEENPDNRVELDNVDKAAQLLTNAYSDAGYTFTEWMTDNVTYTVGTSKAPQHDQAYTWGEFTGDDQDTPTGFWNETYDAIAHANEVIAIIEKLPGDEQKRAAVLGEALLTRAYGHFMLVNLFAKHYDDRNASADPGIPYVEEPETVFVKKYTRLSVKEVYDKVERDLLRGIELVNDQFYANSGKYHFTKNAALAFASRFYLYKGDTEQCIEFSSALLGSDPSVFIKNIPLLQENSVSPQDYILAYQSPTDNSNLLMLRQVSNFHLPNVGHWPSSSMYYGIFSSNPFGATDERTDPAWQAGTDGVAAARYQFLFERTSLTSGIGYNYTIFPAFRGEEVLLNRAESHMEDGDLDEAIADLQRLVNYRYQGTPALTLELLQNYYGSNNATRAIRDYIRDERIKEFLHEGLRWFDIKRYEIDIEHNMPGGGEIELDDNDNRKVLQIPQAAIDVGGLRPNPR